MAWAPTVIQISAVPWDCHRYELTIELTYGLKIMLRLTLAYLEVLGCLAMKLCRPLARTTLFLGLILIIVSNPMAGLFAWMPWRLQGLCVAIGADGVAAKDLLGDLLPRTVLGRR